MYLASYNNKVYFFFVMAHDPKFIIISYISSCGSMVPLEVLCWTFFISTPCKLGCEQFITAVRCSYKITSVASSAMWLKLTQHTSFFFISSSNSLILLCIPSITSSLPGLETAVPKVEVSIDVFLKIFSPLGSLYRPTI